MGLVTRQGKVNKLTIQELDNNLEYLNSNNILSVSYLYDNNNLVIKRPDGYEYRKKINSYNLDTKSNINDNIIIYEDLYKEIFEDVVDRFSIKFDGGVSIIPFEHGKSFTLDANIGYWVNNLYNNTKISSSFLSNPSWESNIEFYIGTGFSYSVNSIAVQSDGKILLGGQFYSYNGVSTNRIIRLNSDGSQDTSFVIGTGFSSYTNSIVIQSDGKILVGGYFYSYNGVSLNRIIRLNPDGSQDTSFVIGTGFNTTVWSIAIQDDGKILVGGQFTSYNGVTSNRIIRLNPDGSQDTSFVIGTGFNNSVDSIVVQSDGKILVGGQFTSYNGVSANRIIRLNTDGSQDTSFVIGTGFNNSVDSIVVQSDGSILVGGQFSSYNGVTSNRIIRLNPDGSQDTSFVIGTGFNYYVNSIVIQSDGKILVGGQFSSYNGVSSNYIIRLNTDGSRDTSFVIGTGFSYHVNSIAVQSDGKILVGGVFTSYNGVTSNSIIRLNPDGSSDTIDYKFNKIVYIFQTNENDEFDIINENDEIKIVCNKQLQKIIFSYKLTMVVI